MIIPWTMAYTLAQQHQRDLLDAARRRRYAQESRAAHRRESRATRRPMRAPIAVGGPHDRARAPWSPLGGAAVPGAGLDV